MGLGALEGESLEARRGRLRAERLERLLRLNDLRCRLAPVYGSEVLAFCTLPPARRPPPWAGLPGAVLSPPQRLEQLQPLLDRFLVALPAVQSPGVSLASCRPLPWRLRQAALLGERLRGALEPSPGQGALQRLLQAQRCHFPELRLVQYDCGKLQTLDLLLRRLKAESHRVLIFTQMTRMLDVLERFLTYHGHIYLRLDGSTRVEQRQALMERFNADKRIFCFILSTRSGGVGVNLAGADTVVFYDSDWNPTMDAQAQDRCHRIGQTRDVHIYRLISERTVEENILKKANQKRLLGDMAIEGGNFTTAYFKQQTIRELFEMAPEEPGRKELDRDRDGELQEEDEDLVATRRTHILEQALCGAEDPEDIRAASQAQAERVAALAEFSDSLSPEEEPRAEPEEETSRAEQEIAALVEQLTPIERYAMNFLEASLEDVSREELKQAEEQVEAARKDIDQAKVAAGRFRLLPPAGEEEEEQEAASGPALGAGAGAGTTSPQPPPATPPPATPSPPSSPSPPSPPAAAAQEPPGEAGAGPGGVAGAGPGRAPRRRRSADVEIRQSRGPGPAAKVLRQLPGRLVTVLETPAQGRQQQQRRRQPPRRCSAAPPAANTRSASAASPGGSPAAAAPPEVALRGRKAKT
ncbi:helicase SRCAP-like [Dryobates pubescens]|uniref:helicase SRCAP-like n=1 Tax=Dryobates pubescens TaxID=118200 RepID=UPI0023BA013A|nr:helicase SRCAP-like [Dryobates pubescens]